MLIVIVNGMQEYPPPSKNFLSANMLTKEQIDDFFTRGYLVVPNVVPLDLREQVMQAILESAKVDLNDNATWYQPSFSGHGIVPMHHHQALWNVRQHPDVHAVFSELYSNRELWVSMDRASYKPPASPTTAKWRREPLHWDVDPWQPQSLSLQGLVLPYRYRS